MDCRVVELLALGCRTGELLSLDGEFLSPGGTTIIGRL